MNDYSGTYKEEIVLLMKPSYWAQNAGLSIDLMFMFRDGLTPLELIKIPFGWKEIRIPKRIPMQAMATSTLQRLSKIDCKIDRYVDSLRRTEDNGYRIFVKNEWTD